jgi:hypothetical protein
MPRWGPVVFGAAVAIVFWLRTMAVRWASGRDGDRAAAHVVAGLYLGLLSLIVGVTAACFLWLTIWLVSRARHRSDRELPRRCRRLAALEMSG